MWLCDRLERACANEAEVTGSTPEKAVTSVNSLLEDCTPKLLQICQKSKDDRVGNVGGEGDRDVLCLIMQIPSEGTETSGPRTGCSPGVRGQGRGVLPQSELLQKATRLPR